MDEGNLLTDDDFRRVGRAVGRSEQSLYSVPASDRANGFVLQVLKVVAGAADDFGYPARIQAWDEAAGTWSDLDSTEVRVEDPNDVELVEGDYVVSARLLGINPAGVGCFAGAKASVPDVSYFNSGKVNLERQYMGRGLKSFERGLDIFSGASGYPGDNATGSVLAPHGFNGSFPYMGPAGLLVGGGVAADTVPFGQYTLQTWMCGGLIVGNQFTQSLGGSSAGQDYAGLYVVPLGQTFHLQGLHFNLPPGSSGLVDSGMSVGELPTAGRPFWGSGEVSQNHRGLFVSGQVAALNGFYAPRGPLLPGPPIGQTEPAAAAWRNGVWAVTGSGHILEFCGGILTRVENGGPVYTPGKLIYAVSPGQLASVPGTRINLDGNVEHKAGLDRWVGLSIGSY